MNYLEIILQDLRKNQLDKLVFEEFHVSTSNVKSSHFFDNINGKDIEFYQIKNLQNVLSPSGTGNVYVRNLDIGCNLENVVMVFSFDHYFGDITLNFPENELFTGDSLKLRMRIKNLVTFLIRLKEKYEIPAIRIGFEPASEDDSCLVEIGQNAFDADSIVEKLMSQC